MAPSVQKVLATSAGALIILLVGLVIDAIRENEAQIQQQAQEIAVLRALWHSYGPSYLQGR